MATQGETFGSMTGGKDGGNKTPRPEQVPLPRGDAESVHGFEGESGGGNVTGGVVRRQRRGFKSVVTDVVGRDVKRNYKVTGTVQVNNIQEFFQDSISPEYAQEIIEEMITMWGVDPSTEPLANQAAEDIIFLHIIAVSASDKGNWAVAYPLPPGRSGEEREANFQMFSDSLARVHGRTRRQFARGIADRIRQYLNKKENVFLLDHVAAKVGCERSLADLAFDGSTHCSGLSTVQVQFTKTLENRNLFERDDLAAEGASARLLSSAMMRGVPRAVN